MKRYELQYYDYHLPDDLIAVVPSNVRDRSKLMICPRRGVDFSQALFRDIVEYIGEGDQLVINDTRVFPARLFGAKSSGARIELLLLEEMEDNLWKAMVRPGRRIKKGAVLDFEGEVSAEVEGIQEDGVRLVRFDLDGNMEDYLDEHGNIPLPPYISRSENKEDRERYQTVYARERGAVAAPTAGLHFTDDLLRKIRNKGAEIRGITLHVGKGTFAPVKTEDIREHKMEKEWYRIPSETVNALEKKRKDKGRIFAVGTTVVRAMESYARTGKTEDRTDIFIYPSFDFKVTDCLITNFHLPKSTLLMLVCAFAGRDRVMDLYEKAVEEEFRFYSYGDACLFL